VSNPEEHGDLRDEPAFSEEKAPAKSSQDLRSEKMEKVMELVRKIRSGEASLTTIYRDNM